MKEKFQATLDIYSNPMPTAILHYFKTQLVQRDLTTFYEAILKDCSLKLYAKHPEICFLWNELLEKNPIFIAEDTVLKQQPNVPSFDLIMGYYIFSKKIDYDNLDSRQSQHFLREGIEEYHSFLCLNVRLVYLFRQLRVKRAGEKQEAINEILAESQCNLPNYYSIKYLLMAYTCYKLSSQDPLLIQQGLDALMVAKKLEPYSTNELFNAFLGNPLMFGKFRSIDAIIDFFQKNFFLNPQQMLTAKRKAEETFQLLNIQVHEEILEEDTPTHSFH